MGAVLILVWGGRCTTVAFFVCAGSELAYPHFPPWLTQALVAACEFMLALVFLVMAEALSAYFIILPGIIRKTKDPMAELQRVFRAMFSIISMGTTSVRGIIKATTPPQLTKDPEKPKSGANAKADIPPAITEHVENVKEDA